MIVIIYQISQLYKI